MGFKYVMEDIFFSGTPLLESVGNLEPHIVELKEKIIKMLRQALIPIKAYAKIYERYTQLVNLNIDNYVKLVHSFFSFDINFETCMNSIFQKGL
jgi:dynein heavy chain